MGKKKFVIIVTFISLIILTTFFVKYGPDLMIKEKDEYDELIEFRSKSHTEKLFLKSTIPENIKHLDKDIVFYQISIKENQREIKNNELIMNAYDSSEIFKNYTFQWEIERTRKLDDHKKNIFVRYEKLIANIYSLEGEKPVLKETIDVQKLMKANNIKPNPTELIKTNSTNYEGQEAIVVETENNPALLYLVDKQKTVLVEDYPSVEKAEYKKKVLEGKTVFDIYTETNFNDEDKDNRIVGFYFTNVDALTYTLSSENNKNIALFKKYPEILEYLKNDNLITELYVYNPDPNKIEDYLKDSVVEGKNPYSGMVLGERQTVDEKEHIITSLEEFKKWYKPFDFSKE